MRYQKIKCALAAVAAAAALMPATAGASVPSQRCTVVPVGDSVGTHLVVGEATAPGAIAMTLRCGIVQYGRVVHELRVSMPGSVVAGVWLVRIAPGSYSVCDGVHAVFLDGTEIRDDRCP